MINVERVQLLIQSRNMTYKELGKAAGIQASAVHRYCTGITKNVPDERIAAIAKALGTTPEYLVGWDADDPQTEKEKSLLAAYKSLNPQNQALLDDLLGRLLQAQK